jgi:predicted dehydrogenase
LDRGAPATVVTFPDTRALVIGYGSIGARHVRVLEALKCHVDVVSRRANVHPRRHESVARALASATYDYAIVADETSQHASTLRALHDAGFTGTVLVEKPLGNPGDAFERVDRRRIAVAYQLRFDPLMRRLQALIQSETLIAAEIRASSYLPEWRPGRDYRQTESASQRAGGGVLRDMSHELDYVLWLFGAWRRVTAIGGHLSTLEIDSDDAYAVLMETERCRSVIVSLNYLDRREERWVVVNTTQATIKADIYNRTLVRNGETLFSGNAADVDQTYVDENRAMLGGRVHEACSFGEGLAVVNLVGAIERASRERRWVDA